mmetsp:Transcript_22658/g.57745  ORF Transcript_22658/g.57745 Transcript_22658/m.57745 type:complete len:115 (-) Transcript_22658:493-837(-)
MAKNQPVYFEVYRYTSLGYTLQDTLGDLIEQGEITQDKSTEIMKAFDKAMNEGLASMDLPPVKMKGPIKEYRHTDSVWTLVLNDAKVDFGDDTLTTSKLKLVACDGQINKVDKK